MKRGSTKKIVSYRTTSPKLCFFACTSLAITFALGFLLTGTNSLAQGSKSCVQAQKGQTVPAQGNHCNLSSLNNLWARLANPNPRISLLSVPVYSDQKVPPGQRCGVTSFDHQLPSLLSPLSTSATDFSSHICPSLPLLLKPQKKQIRASRN